MVDFPECDRLKGRMRLICRGESGLPTEKTLAYRRLWGLPPIGHVDSVPRQAKTPSATFDHRAGTNLAKLLKAINIPVKDGCTCEEWITKMNGWTIAENIEHRQEIIDHLKGRAAKEKMSIKQTAWTGLLIIFNGVRPTVGGLVEEAIRRAAVSLDLVQTSSDSLSTQPQTVR